MSVHKIWFSLFDLSYDYKGHELPFQSPNDFRWAKDFEVHYEDICAELQQFLSKNNPSPYFKHLMVDKKNAYRTISLKWWDLVFRKNGKFFPVTNSIMLKYPEITTLSFNFLAPGSTISPHCGDTNAIFRCHFGLQIPAQAPTCALKVKGIEKSWTNGKWLIFTDAYVHEAYNSSKEERIIILMDVLRPEFKKKRNWMCSVVFSSLFIQKRATYFTFLNRLPKGVLYTMAALLIPFSFLSRKCLNLIRYY
jgi:ornithine lipid ester-linked acyl 2-hydroxylase